MDVRVGLESWATKSWNFRTGVLEKILQSPLNSKEIQPVHPEGNQCWILIRRTDAEAETPILWPPDAKNWLLRKDPNAGKDLRWEEKGTTEDEMVGWHHWLTDMSLNRLWELVIDREAWHAAVHRVTKTWLSDLTELNWRCLFMAQLSNPFMTTGKTIALIRQTFVGKVLCLCFLICYLGCS